MRVVVSVCLVLAACGGGRAAEQKPLSAKWVAPPMLGHVPADSPYVAAQLEPMSDATRAAMFDALDEKVRRAVELARELPADVDRSQLDASARMSIAFAEELRGRDLKRWGRELGFDPSGRFVLYGHSVWPVLRIAVADPARLRGVAGRVLAAGNFPRLGEQTYEGVRYWQASSDGITAIVAVLDKEAVMSVLPTEAVAEHLPLLFGKRLPANKLADTNRVPELLAKHRLLPLMFGYVDARVAVDILTRRAKSANTSLDRLLHTATGPISDECRSDLDRLVAIAPRVVFGYHRLDPRVAHGSVIVELAPSIAAALGRLRVAIPGLTSGLGSALFSFGIAAKLDDLIPLVRRMTSHVQQQPFRCTWFAPLNDAAQTVAKVIDRPLPPAVQGLRGAVVVAEDFEREPLTVNGHLLVAGDHAPDLLSIILNQVPGLAGIAVPPDGSSVALPIAQLGLGANLSVHAAARADRAAIAVGSDSPMRASQLLATRAPKHSPLFSVVMDVERLQALGFFDPKQDDDDMKNLRDVALQLEVDDNGLRMEAFVTLKPL